MEIDIDYKDEENLELAWGYWFADEDYNKWIINGKKKQKEAEQLELFGDDNNSN